MTTSISDIIFVTDRHLSKGSFLERIDSLASFRPRMIILREKDMDRNGYLSLAGEVIQICARYGTECVLNSYIIPGITSHLPIGMIREGNVSEHFGASCHSVSEAVEAERLGAEYIIAGHIFDTDCKKGIPGRGLGFLRSVADAVSIPVYGIGGINGDNISSVRKACAGAALMKSAMEAEDIPAFIEALKEGL